MNYEIALSRITDVLDAETNNLRSLVEVAGLDPTKDLVGLPFPEALLEDQDLSRFNFSECDLKRANLRGVDLTEANLREANLTEANLRGANLTEANLREANLTGANLTGANLTGVDLTEASLIGAHLTGANLTEAQAKTVIGLYKSVQERPVEETVIPVVKEEFHVGTRATRRRVRIYTSVQETPVEETVRLRDEEVHVERRAADRPLSGAERETAFRETEVEIDETHEEAVVSKEARVVEEVAVGKDVREREEVVRDTVRRTDVDVEETRTPRKERT